MSDGGDGGRLSGRLIGVGVTASIAAYKAVEIVRLLRAEGADVAVMLTPSATRFVGALSFSALSRYPVETDVLDLLPDQRIGHIVIADSADAIKAARTRLAEALPGYKQPRRFETIADLPRTATGKVQRHKLRERLKREH